MLPLSACLVPKWAAGWATCMPVPCHAMQGCLDVQPRPFGVVKGLQRAAIGGSTIGGFQDNGVGKSRKPRVASQHVGCHPPCMPCAARPSLWAEACHPHLSLLSSHPPRQSAAAGSASHSPAWEVQDRWSSIARPHFTSLLRALHSCSPCGCVQPVRTDWLIVPGRTASKPSLGM